MPSSRSSGVGARPIMSDLAPTVKKSSESTPEHYVLDGILGPDELVWIYHTLLSAKSWTLLKTSTPAAAASFLPFMHYPGLLIERRGKIHSEFLSGYFRSVIFRVRDSLK